jgi:hypothetical protein
MVPLFGLKMQTTEQDIPHRVLFRRGKGKRTMGLVFPSKQLADNFAQTVTDPFIQPASEPIPEHLVNTHKSIVASRVKKSMPYPKSRPLDPIPFPRS